MDLDPNPKPWHCLVNHGTALYITIPAVMTPENYSLIKDFRVNVLGPIFFWLFLENFDNCHDFEEEDVARRESLSATVCVQPSTTCAGTSERLTPGHP